MSERTISPPPVPPGGRPLFVRQSSGLVRSVSVTNALFFNVAAFVGLGITLYPLFYTLPGAPLWKHAGISAYGWAAIITGLFCVVLAVIFASLTSAMPRSGGDYVFTSRILNPFLGWLESWTLVIASVLIIAFEVPLVLRNIQITARIIGIGSGGHVFQHANGWFTDSSGAINGTRGFLASLVVVAAIGAVALLPTRRFHRVVTALAAFGLSACAAMFILGLAATHRSDFEHNLPQYTGGTTAAHIAATGHPRFLGPTGNSVLGDLFSTSAFPLFLSVLLFSYLGFQYSAYISGEVRGTVKRSVLLALIGALAIGVLVNSLYVDAISNHLGFDTNVSWSATYWGFNDNLAALPLGQPNSMPLLAVIANKGLWPIWALISLAGTVFPFLLCPVYVNLISRIQLAWSLDRQAPSWFGEVNERLRAPVNAILATLALTALFVFFQSFKALPTVLATTGHRLNLAGTAWFSITMALLTWVLPGVNALLARARRPALMRNAPFARSLPWLGLLWLVFPLWVYVFAVFKPIKDALSSGTGHLTYLENNGIIDAMLFYAIGVALYLVMRRRRRASGVDDKLMFAEIPPE